MSFVKPRQTLGNGEVSQAGGGLGPDRKEKSEKMPVRDQEKERKKKETRGLRASERASEAGPSAVDGTPYCSFRPFRPLLRYLSCYLSPQLFLPSARRCALTENHT